MRLRKVITAMSSSSRILVNGVEPLASWLLDNSRDLWDNFRAKSEIDEQEQIIATQMNYNFLVQITAGLDVRYSLTSPLWNAAQFGGAASSVQTSQLQLFFNGFDASLAAGAKTGTAVIATTAGVGKQPIIHPIGELKLIDDKIAATDKQIQETTDKLKPDFAPEVIKPIQDQLEKLQEKRKRLQARRAQLQKLPPLVVPSVPRQPGQSRGYLAYPPALTPPQ